jgi:hypothetical protein
MDGSRRTTTTSSSTINVTWGYGNRGDFVEGFNSGVSQGVVTKKIYRPKAIFSASPNPIIAGQSTNIGLTFANKSQF